MFLKNVHFLSNTSQHHPGSYQHEKTGQWRRNPSPHDLDAEKWALNADNSAKSVTRMIKLCVLCKLTKFSVCHVHVIQVICTWTPSTPCLQFVARHMRYEHVSRLILSENRTRQYQIRWFTCVLHPSVVYRDWGTIQSMCQVIFGVLQVSLVAYFDYLTTWLWRK